MSKTYLSTALVLLSALAGCDGTGSALTCDEASADALQTCIAAYSARQQACLTTTDALCAKDDSELEEALSGLDATTCVEGELGAIDIEALPGRLRNACASEADALAWRSFGGPRATAWTGATDNERVCLETAHDLSVTFVQDSLAAITTCLEEDCTLASLRSARQDLADAAISAVTGNCGDIGSLVAVDAETFIAKADLQVDCITAAARQDTDGLGLRCGPSYTDITAERGVWNEVVVDGETWGTQCGDGSEFAFWLRPAPEGQPLDRVVVALQGGGVCLFGEDCAPRFAGAPNLFDARGIDDMPGPFGISSSDPEVSPFHDWTMLYVPYCNQDVFAGGGVIEDLGSIQLPRYGSVNLRASVRMLRDYLWRELDDAGGQGFRSDELVALFGGFSAGGYGTLYNYHWFLDDLLWPKTSAYPDGGLAVDNGELFGVGSLGAVKIPAWGMQNNLPAYCFDGPCSSGEVLVNALSPRLSDVPEQNMIMLSNQHDSTQSRDAFFSDDGSFINALRQMYCDTRDLDSIHWYLTSVSDESQHVVSLREELFTGTVDGAVMSDVLLQAVLSPEELTSHVEEGDFVDVIDGVEPFPCELP